MTKIDSADLERLKKIVKNYDDLIKQIDIRNITREQVLNDQFIQWAITTPLYNIGEHTNNLSKTLTEKYNDIPWNKVAGLRHRLVHHYEGTNWSIIVEVVFDDLPKFAEQIKGILEGTNPSE
jgi:uncharacterized protein with HEPN domain